MPVIYRSKLDELVASGELFKYSKGIYYVPYTTILGTVGKISAEKLIEKLYVRKLFRLEFLRNRRFLRKESAS